jgi:hypothetical protein
MSHETGGIEKGEAMANSPEKDFDFTAKEVLNALRPQGGRSLEYIGTATSDFQAEPLIYDEKGEPVIVSDWELNITNKLEGKNRVSKENKT